MAEKLIAKASIKINAPVAKVWDAFVNPAVIKKYMWNTNVESEFKEGTPIYWRGEWDGKPYEDKGNIDRVIPNKLLQYSYYSPMTGLPETPENYFHIVNDLQEVEDGVIITITQDGSKDEKARQHSEDNWNSMLQSLKKLLEE